MVDHAQDRHVKAVLVAGDQLLHGGPVAPAELGQGLLVLKGQRLGCRGINRGWPGVAGVGVPRAIERQGTTDGELEASGCSTATHPLTQETGIAFREFGKFLREYLLRIRCHEERRRSGRIYAIEAPFVAGGKERCRGCEKPCSGGI